MAEDTFYEFLGVSPDASQDDIRSSYRRLTQQVHPDCGGSAPLFRSVQIAYETLSDPVRRADYDQALQGNTNSAANSDNSQTHQKKKDTPSERVYRAQPAPPLANVDPKWIARHPWLVVVVFGFLLESFGLRSLGSIGALFVIAGVLAGVGSRQARRRIDTQRSSIDAVDEMSGSEFEDFLGQLFSQIGYHAKVVGRSGDYGADLVLTAGNVRTVVQAKRWVKIVGVDGVREAAAARAYYQAQVAMVVTNSTFSAPAQILAKANRVVLWDRSTLVHHMSELSGSPQPLALRLLLLEFRCGLSVILSYVPQGHR